MSKQDETISNFMSPLRFRGFACSCHVLFLDVWKGCVHAEALAGVALPLSSGHERRDRLSVSTNISHSIPPSPASRRIMRVRGMRNHPCMQDCVGTSCTIIDLAGDDVADSSPGCACIRTRSPPESTSPPARFCDLESMTRALDLAPSKLARQSSRDGSDEAMVDLPIAHRDARRAAV